MRILYFYVDLLFGTALHSAAHSDFMAAFYRGIDVYGGNNFAAVTQVDREANCRNNIQHG